ncbi:MAG: protein kinase [Planctomycetes bacterium]|nr:protein kinase [Planctomycetota bacterium]
MGDILLAEQEGLGRQVALKILPRDLADDPDALARFQRESQTLAGLTHPHICPIIEAGREDGVHFYAMEYLAGLDLGTVIRLQKIAPRRAAEIAKQIAEALHFAHEQGIIHRDVKPQNIILVRGELRKGSKIAPREAPVAESSPGPAARPEMPSTVTPSQGRTPAETHHDHVYVIDFGLAHRSASKRLTAPGAIMGTAAYMAPEQAGVSHAVSAATDVYAVGAVLYEMLTGRPPFPGETVAEVLQNMMTTDAIRPRKINPQVPRDLEVIALKCLEKNPRRRYPTALELADDLERFLSGEPIEARPPSFFYRVARRVARNRATVVVGGLGLLAALGLATAWYLSTRVVDEPWVRVYQDDFNRTELGPDWTVLRGQATIHDGALCSRNGHEVFAMDFFGDVRMDYTATVMPDSANASELSAFVSGSPSLGLSAGYSCEYGIFGGKGAYHCIQKNRDPRSSTREGSAPIERGRPYRLSIVRRHDSVRLLHENEEAVSSEDPSPLSGSEHGRLGFGSQCEHIHFDDLSVWLPVSEALEWVRGAIEARRWKEAESAARAVLAITTEQAGRDRLRAHIAYCLTQEEHFEEAATFVADIAPAGAEPEQGYMLAVTSMEAFTHRGAWDEAFEAYAKAARCQREAAKPLALGGTERPELPLRHLISAMLHTSPPDADRVLRGWLARCPDTAAGELICALAVVLGRSGRLLMRADVPSEFWDRGTPYFPDLADACVTRTTPDAKRTPEDGMALVRQAGDLALWRLAEGRDDAARELLLETEAIRRGQGMPVTTSEAFAWALLGDNTRALERKAEWDRSSAVEREYVGLICLMLGRDEEAWTVFSKLGEFAGSEFLSIRSNYGSQDDLLSNRITPEAYLSRVETVLSTGEPGATDPGSQHFYLGLRYEKDGQPDKAAEQYRLFLASPVREASFVAFLKRRREELLNSGDKR